MRKSNYSLHEMFQNVFFVFLSKLLIPKSRMIRFPIVIRGKNYIDFGKMLTTGRYCRMEVNGIHKEKCLILGDNVNVGDFVSIRCANRINIGNNVLIGSKVLIIDNSHGIYSGDIQDTPDTPPNDRNLVCSPIEIGDNVWIADGAVIQKGVTIGKGSIVAANSVVTKNVPCNVIVGGAPARVLRIFDEENGRWEKCQ